MNDKDTKKLIDLVTYLIDKGMNFDYLIDSLLCRNDYNNWHDELDFVQKFTEEEIKEFLNKLDKDNVIAIDPENKWTVVVEWMPNTAAEIRLKQKYGWFLKYERKVKKTVVDKYYIITNKRTKHVVEADTYDEVMKHCCCSFEDKRENRKGRPSNFDYYKIEEKFREKEVEMIEGYDVLRKLNGDIVEDKDEVERIKAIYDEN